MTRMERDNGARRMGGATRIVAGVVAVLAYFGVKEGLTRYTKHRKDGAEAATWGLDPKTAERIRTTQEREMATLQFNPLFQKFVENEVAAHHGVVDGKSLGRDLVARGLARLPDRELLELHDLKKKLVVASERLCPCFYDPSPCAEGELMDGLSRLSETDLIMWMRLSAAAGLAELRANEPFPPTDSDLSGGLVALSRGLSSERRARLLAVFQSKAPPKPEQCFAVQTLFLGADSLEPKQQPRFVRALANLGVKR